MFKLPFLRTKAEPTYNLTTFEDDDIEDVVEIGRGTYGDVFKAKKSNETVVVKRSSAKDAHERALVLKEARILSEANHENIVKFLGFNGKSSSILLEFVEFSFSILGINHDPVNNLRELLRDCDEICDFERMEHLQCIIMNDVLSGLSYLHHRNIVHRDLKPENVLVSNKHFLERDSDIEIIWNTKPVVAKLTDFGESRSDLIQTLQISQNTRNLNRGTPAYMAPECLLQTALSANQSSLKMMDIWSLGMIAHCLCNPDSCHPYMKELMDSPILNKRKALEELLSNKQPPCHLPKYQTIRTKYWESVNDVFQACSVFEVENRPTVEDVVLSFSRKSATEQSLGDMTNENRGDITQSQFEGRLTCEKDQKTDKLRTSYLKHGVHSNDYDSDLPEASCPSEPDLQRSYFSQLHHDRPKHDCFSFDSEEKGEQRSLKTKVHEVEVLEDEPSKKKIKSDHSRNDFDERSRPGGNENPEKNGRYPATSDENENVKEPKDTPTQKSREIRCRVEQFPTTDPNLLPVADKSYTNWPIGSPSCPESNSNGGTGNKRTSFRVEQSPTTDPNSLSEVDQPHADWPIGSPSCVESDSNGGTSNKRTRMKPELHDTLAEKPKINIDSGHASLWTFSIFGDFHQASEGLFEHGAAGAQCSSICVVAVIASMLKCPFEWTSTDVNNVLVQGDQCHLKQLYSLGWPLIRESALLDTDELSSVITFNWYGHNVKASVGLMTDGMYGFDLCKVLAMALSVKPNNSFILRVGDKCRALIRCGDDDEYCMFDSHSCTPGGLISADGAACVLMFNSTAKLIQFMAKVDYIGQVDVIPIDAVILEEGPHQTMSILQSESHLLPSCSTVNSALSVTEDTMSEVEERGQDEQNGSESLPRSFYNDDQQLPIYMSGRVERYTPVEAVEILQMRHERMCTKTPLRVRQNFAFLIDLIQLNDINDIKCDMNGTYPINLRAGIWTLKINGYDITIMNKKKVDITGKNEFHLSINSKKNTAGLCRSIFVLFDNQGDVVNNLGLLQYHIDQKMGKNEVNFTVPAHGNKKHIYKPFYPMQKSTLVNMKSCIREGTTAAAVYSQFLGRSRGIMGVDNPGQLPRSRHQIYNMKNNVSKPDDITELSLYVRSKEENILIEHSDAEDDLWILGTETMRSDLVRFSTSKEASYPFSVDPTFEFGRFEVTPFAYRHLLLKSIRSNVPPVFLGPTAIHHRKDTETYKRIVTSLTATLPSMKRNVRGFITDGEIALYSAIEDSFPDAIGLRCFRHFSGNCQDKLNKIGIRDRRSQEFFLQSVFGRKRGGLVDCSDPQELDATIQQLQERMNQKEAALLSKDDCSYQSKFWTYIKKQKDVIAKHMLPNVRLSAGMPIDDQGMALRSYTNQSESLNNMLTRQKQVVVGNGPKKVGPLSKLSFVKNVWEEVYKRQQEDMQRAICGISDEFVLSDIAAHLAVSTDEWFSWTVDQRQKYVAKFNCLTMAEVINKNQLPTSAPIIKKTVQPRLAFSIDINRGLLNATNLSKDLISGLVTEAEELLNMPYAIREAPYTEANKPKQTAFQVASKLAKNTKFPYLICKVYKEHVNCECTPYKRENLCKHSLCVAEKCSLLEKQLQHISGSRNKRTPPLLCNPPKDTAGKKGGQHKNRPRNRPAPTSASASASVATAEIQIPDRLFDEVHHNNFPLEVCFLQDEDKATECRQCSQEFPRLRMIRPYDIVLSHKERWTYTSKEEPNIRKCNRKYTVKFYCVRSSCIIQRFSYFTKEFLSIPDDIRKRLSPSHIELLRYELNADI